MDGDVLISNPTLESRGTLREDALETSKFAFRWGAWLMNLAGLPACVLSTDMSLFSPNA